MLTSTRILLDNLPSNIWGYVSNNYSDEYIGKKGKAFTVLKPSGKVIIDEKLCDATSYDGFIEKNSKIKVVGNEGSALKVSKI